MPHIQLLPMPQECPIYGISEESELVWQLLLAHLILRFTRGESLYYCNKLGIQGFLGKH
jgi:hypothetical protein